MHIHQHEGSLKAAFVLFLFVSCRSARAEAVGSSGGTRPGFLRFLLRNNNEHHTDVEVRFLAVGFRV